MWKVSSLPRFLPYPCVEFPHDIPQNFFVHLIPTRSSDRSNAMHSAQKIENNSAINTWVNECHYRIGFKAKGGCQKTLILAFQANSKTSPNCCIFSYFKAYCGAKGFWANFLCVKKSHGRNTYFHFPYWQTAPVNGSSLYQKYLHKITEWKFLPELLRQMLLIASSSIQYWSLNANDLLLFLQLICNW